LKDSLSSAETIEIKGGPLSFVVNGEQVANRYSSFLFEQFGPNKQITSSKSPQKKTPSNSPRPDAVSFF